MKSYWKMIVFSGLFFTTITLLPKVCSAQLGGPDEDPDAPIDGGVGVLIAAGIGYGVKKYRDANKKNKEINL